MKWAPLPGPLPAPQGEGDDGALRSRAAAAGRDGVLLPLRSGGLRFCALLLLAACTREKTPEPLRVAAASDLTDAFEALAPLFPEEVRFTFGASGLLSKQLAEGAPYDAFFSASAHFVDEAVNAGACDAATVRGYARGRIALVGQLDGRGRIALANPERAPYGLAAKQLLQRDGSWEALQGRLVFAENVRQALQLYDTGNVEGAYVAWSNVVTRDGGALLLDEARHEPIAQARALCRHGKNPAAAQRFVQFLDSPQAREVLARHGFAPP